MNNQIKTKGNQWDDYFFNSKWSVYLIILITSLITLPNITRESLWIDEIFSATISLKVDSLQEMFTQYILKDVHPPFYQVLLYFWGDFVGSSDFSIRFLSYLSVLISLSFSYFLLVKHFPKRIAIIFIAISAFTPGVLYYAQEARSYAILYGMSNILSVIFVIFMSRIRENRDVPLHLQILFLITGILVSYTHYFGYILIFSLNIILLIYSALLHRKKLTVQILSISLLIAIPAILWLFIAFNHGNILEKTAGNFWIENNFLRIVLRLASFFIGNIMSLCLLILATVFIILPIQNFFKALRRHALMLVPLLIILITSTFISIHSPITTARNLIIIFPLILIFISFIFYELYMTKKVFVTFYILILVTASAYKNYTYVKQDWRSASRYIEDNFDNTICKVPTRGLKDRATDQDWLMYPSYYLGTEYSYLKNGPEIQSDCNLIYFDGYTTKENIIKLITKKNITKPYKILNFQGVYVVVKDENRTL